MILQLWHMLTGTHKWSFYCKACREDPGHSYLANAGWHCDCGAQQGGRNMNRTFIAAIVVALGSIVLAVAAAKLTGGPMAGNCTFYVGAGTNGCLPTSAGTISGSHATSSYARRSDNTAALTSSACSGFGGQRLVVWYTNTSGQVFLQKWGAYGACSVVMGGSNGIYARAWCSISPAPFQPRSGYCFTRW